MIANIEKRVYDLYCLSLTTKKILLLLTNDVTLSSKRTIPRIRKRIGIRLRVNNPAERDVRALLDSAAGLLIR
jgi:hypothetical protein